jgi:hypothetical protein
VNERIEAELRALGRRKEAAETGNA